MERVSLIGVRRINFPNEKDDHANIAVRHSTEKHPHIHELEPRSSNTTLELAHAMETSVPSFFWERPYTRKAHQPEITSTLLVFGLKLTLK